MASPKRMTALTLTAGCLTIATLATFASARAAAPRPGGSSGRGSVRSGGPDQARGNAAWNAELAAHLLARAGFGGTPEQVDYLVQLGKARAVDYLIDYESIAFNMPAPQSATGANLKAQAAVRQIARDQKGDRRAAASGIADVLRFEAFAVRELQNWWLRRMSGTPRPLEEKMTLFWHGHFTSGFREVKNAGFLHQQNELFRRLALGNFRDLLIQVSRDPAMLIYLNNAQNRAGKPNENYARELLELFTLGVGHYTEKDIKEAARAFTGWSIDRDAQQFIFRRRMHDDGPKTFLGRTGNFDGTDIIDIILQQPAAAEHLVAKLWKFFAGADLAPLRRRQLAEVLRKNNYELKPLMRAMLKSEAFYAVDVRSAAVKSPVELVVGALRALEIVPEDCAVLSAAMRTMGQELFQPPNVKGWDGGAAWITTATLFNRYNLLATLIYGTTQRGPGFEQRMMERLESAGGDELDTAMSAYALDTDELMTNQPPFDPLPLLDRHTLSTPEKIVDHFVRRLIQRPIAADRRQVLIDELRRVGGDCKLDGRSTAHAVRGLIHLIVSMPEYQLK